MTTLIVVHGEAAREAAARYTGIDAHHVISHPAPHPPGLYPHPDSARRCRDYALLAAAAAHPDHTHYWLVDAAAFLHTATPATLFAHFATDDADLLAPALSPRGPNWPPGAQLLALGQRPFGCRLVVARLSARAIATLLDARRRQSAMPTLATQEAWPRDEAMVPTTLAAAGLVCRDLNTATIWTNPHSIGGAPHDLTRLAATPPDNLIYHPAHTPAHWAIRAEALLADSPPGARSLANAAGLRGPRAAQELGGIGQICLDHPSLADQALVPLMLANRPADQAAVARVFAAGTGDTTLATVHPALCRLPRHHMGIVKPTDFTLGHGLALRRFPRHAALPYAYDLDAMELCLTVHAALDGLLARPFLYAGQRDLARMVARVAVDRLAEIYGPPDPAAAPVLVFSIGRTGSTLFKQLIGCATPRAFSEPDAITQLAESGPALAALPQATRHALIHHALVPFITLRLPGGADGRCVIKLRSQANGIAGEVARALPAAKYVFMLRERVAWARSTFRAFGLTPAATVGRLRQAGRALHALREAGVDLSVIHYEDVVADPFGAVARLTGADPHADPAPHARVAEAAAADSQAGHGLSRARTATARAGEGEWMAAFEASWAEEEGLLF